MSSEVSPEKRNPNQRHTPAPRRHLKQKQQTVFDFGGAVNEVLEVEPKTIYQAKTKPKGITPPFDLFGSVPKFFLEGKTRSVSWFGCILSVVMVVVMILLLGFMFKSYREKKDSDIRFTQVSNPDRKKVDLGDKGMMLMMEHYPPEIEWLTFLYLTASHVTENPKKKTRQVTPLAIIPCSSITFQGKEIKYA